MNKPRARKEAARVLAVHLQARYRALLEANRDAEIVVATGALAQCMYENVEFLIWALKSLGGMNPPPPEMLHKISAPLPVASNDPIAEDLGAFTCPACGKGPGHANDCPWNRKNPGVDLSTLPCSCDPVHDALLQSMRHATNCPKHEPA